MCQTTLHSLKFDYHIGYIYAQILTTSQIRKNKKLQILVLFLLIKDRHFVPIKPVFLSSGIKIMSY